MVTRDLFWEQAQSRLTANGWVFTSGHRYDPTWLIGVTPSGRAFRFDMDRTGLITITVAGRTRTRQVSAGDHEDGAGVVTNLITTWELLPVNQR